MTDHDHDFSEDARRVARRTAMGQLGTPPPAEAVALAMQRVADAQRALVELTISGAKTIAERQQQLADLLRNGAPAVPRDPEADTLIVGVDWDVRAVTLTQTTGRVLRVAVNGGWAELPDRARISLSFNDVPRDLS